jgi:hypothetical protein
MEELEWRKCPGSGESLRDSEGLCSLGLPGPPIHWPVASGPMRRTTLLRPAAAPGPSRTPGCLSSITESIGPTHSGTEHQTRLHSAVAADGFPSRMTSTGCPVDPIPPR